MQRKLSFFFDEAAYKHLDIIKNAKSILAVLVNCTCAEKPQKKPNQKCTIVKAKFL